MTKPENTLESSNDNKVGKYPGICTKALKFIHSLGYKLGLERIENISIFNKWLVDPSLKYVLNKGGPSFEMKT